MNETKEKIQEMIKEEAAAKRREALEESREKMSPRKDKGKRLKQERTSLDEEKKKLYRGLLFSVSLILVALGLFYGASFTKESASDRYQLEQEASALKELEAVMTLSDLTFKDKINHFNQILTNPEYINNFNDPSWQEIIKTELAALLGEQAVIELIPTDFSNDVIIDKPEMGYAVLSLLEELKKTDDIRSVSHLKTEVHRATNSEKARLIFLRKVTFKDTELKKDVTIGYILANLSPDFMKELLNKFKPESGYIEIVQKFSRNTSVLAKKGDSSLKTMSVVASRKMKNTEWTFKFWPTAQRADAPALLFWQSFILLGLGSLAFVSAMILLSLIIKKYRSALYVALPERQKNKSNIQKPETKKTAVIQDSEAGPAKFTQGDDITNVMFNSDVGIAVNDGNDSESDYLSSVTEKIFRAYDIRGVVGEYINVEVFRQIAYAVAAEMSELQQDKIAIAYDGRTSSPELVKVLIDALLENGIDVADIGMATSPMLYYAAITKVNGNGIIVTASHNPADYNGMKIMLKGLSYGGQRLQKLKQRVINGDSVAGSDTANGKLEKLNVLDDYFAKIMSNVILARPMKIVIDTGNGVTGKFATDFFEQLGCKVVAINSEVNGNFPVHEPDPSRPENMAELIQKVIDLKADVGIAFDGDGDRIGLVSSGGEIIWPDRILMLLAKDILSRNQDAKILYDVKSSGKLEGFISELGGKPMMCQSGHSFMKARLLEEGALLAGEMSGHIFIKERWFGFDDGLFVAARILEILSIDLRKSRQIFAELPDSLNTPEILIATGNSMAIMEKISADNSLFHDAKVITIDGLRVEYSDGWGLVRASNTTDNLTLRFEADNEAAMQRIANTFKETLLAAAPELEFPF